jgi:hypothetical protein
MVTNITAVTTGNILSSPLSGEQLQIAILVTLFLGIIGRTYLYFIVEKRKAEKLGEPPLKFDFDFIITAIIAAVASGFVAVLSFNESALLVPQGTSLVGVFVIVGGFAFGTNELLNKVLSFIEFNRILESPKFQNEVQKLNNRKNEGEQPTEQTNK